MQGRLWKTRHECGPFPGYTNQRREPLVPAYVRWHHGWSHSLDLRIWDWQHSDSAAGLVDWHKACGGRGLDTAFHWNGAALRRDSRARGPARFVDLWRSQRGGWPGGRAPSYLDCLLY